MFFLGWFVGGGVRVVGWWWWSVEVVVVGLFQGCACGEYISMGEYDGTRGLLCWFVCFR